MYNRSALESKSKIMHSTKHCILYTAIISLQIFAMKCIIQDTHHYINLLYDSTWIDFQQYPIFIFLVNRLSKLCSNWSVLTIALRHRTCIARMNE